MTENTEIYDIKTDKWSQGKDLDVELAMPSLVSINDQYLYAIGGSFLDVFCIGLLI